MHKESLTEIKAAESFLYIFHSFNFLLDSKLSPINQRITEKMLEHLFPTCCCAQRLKYFYRKSFFCVNQASFFVFVLFFPPQHEHRTRLSLCNKICYAIGGAPYQITGCALGFFLQLYLLDVAQVSDLKLHRCAFQKESLFFNTTGIVAGRKSF